jgi:site-specific recombinase XerD
MQRLPLGTDQFLARIPRDGLADGPINLSHNTPLESGNQLENRAGRFLSSSQDARIGSCGRADFDRILHRLRALQIPGRDHLEDYLHDRYRRNLRQSSIQNSSRIITDFLKLVKREGKGDLAQITRSDLGAYIEKEQDRGLRPSTVRFRLDTLKAFMRYLIEKQIVSSDILFKRMIIKVPQSLPKAMEMEDERRLLSVIDDVRNRAMILLLLRTGMRIGELLSTRPADIDLEENKILIWEAQKNRIGRAVYFTDDAKDALLAWYERRDPIETYIFYGRNHQGLTYAAARVMFRNYLAKAELSPKGYTLHCLRHTYASSLLNAGMPLECLRELLGHQSIEVTRRYARLTNATRESEYFKAMGKIERGQIDGHYRLDPQLQKIVEEKELLTPDGEKLHE